MFENKELQKFYSDIQEDTKAQLLSEEEGSNPEQIFTDLALSLLAEAGETENYIVSYDEKISKRGVEHKINAYALYENYETLDLFVTVYNSSDSIQQIGKTDAEKAIERAVRFFRNAIYKDYINEIEESSEVFDLAQTLANLPEIKEFLTRVNIFLITNGIVKSDIKNTTNKVSGYLLFYRVIDLNYLFNLSESSGVPIEINLNDYNATIPCIEACFENHEYQSYLAIMPGQTLALIYEQYGPRLLEQNVRSFLQFTGKINKGIRKTILEEPHMFLAFNNGITATAEEIRLNCMPNNGVNSISFLKDFQIVNGGQTTASIYHTWKKNKADISDIYVQIKISIIKNKNNFAETVSRIAEYANTQNKVSASDLSSNIEGLILLEKISRSVWSPPKKGESIQTRWFFERARGQYKNERNRHGFTPAKRKAFDLKNPRKQVLTKEMLAKYENSFNEVFSGKRIVVGPHFVVRGSQKNYAQFLNYNFEPKPTDLYFEDLVAKAILFKTAEKIYGIKPNALGDLRYIVVPYAIAWVSYKLAHKINLEKIWRDQEIDESFKAKLKEIMISIENHIKTNATGSLYGEWAKSEECWRSIRDQNLNIDLSMSEKWVYPVNHKRRYAKSESEIDEVVLRNEEDLIKSIPLSKWSAIGKLTKQIPGLSQHLKDRSINILSALRLNKRITEKQRSDALKIIDLVISKSPDFFDEQTETLPESTEREKSTIDNIQPEMIRKMVEWDAKARVLSPNEQSYLASFAYGLKKLNDFHQKNILRHYQRLTNAGFNS